MAFLNTEQKDEIVSYQSTVQTGNVETGNANEQATEDDALLDNGMLKTKTFNYKKYGAAVLGAFLLVAAWVSTGGRQGSSNITTTFHVVDMEASAMEAWPDMEASEMEAWPESVPPLEAGSTKCSIVIGDDDSASYKQDRTQSCFAESTSQTCYISYTLPSDLNNDVSDIKTQACGCQVKLTADSWMIVGNSKTYCTEEAWMAPNETKDLKTWRMTSCFGNTSQKWSNNIRRVTAKCSNPNYVKPPPPRDCLASNRLCYLNNPYERDRDCKKCCRGSYRTTNSGSLKFNWCN